MNIKASFVEGKKKILRRYKVDKFEDFIRKAKEFSGTENEKELVFKYLDEEKDFITFSTKEEFDYCFERFQKNGNESFLRVNIIAKPKTQQRKKDENDGIEFLFSRLPFFSGFESSRFPKRRNQYQFNSKRFTPVSFSPLARRFSCLNNIRKMQPNKRIEKRTNPFVFKMMKPSIYSVFPREAKKEVEKKKVMKKEKKEEKQEIEKLNPEEDVDFKQEEIKIPKKKEEEEEEIMEIQKEKKEEKKEEIKMEEKKESRYLYQNELNILEKMGFSNTQLNKQLLNLKKGDLRTVVATILSLEK